MPESDSTWDHLMDAIMGKKHVQQAESMEAQLEKFVALADEAIANHLELYKRAPRQLHVSADIMDTLALDGNDLFQGVPLVRACKLRGWNIGTSKYWTSKLQCETCRRYSIVFERLLRHEEFGQQKKKKKKKI